MTTFLQKKQFQSATPTINRTIDTKIFFRMQPTTNIFKRLSGNSMNAKIAPVGSVSPDDSTHEFENKASANISIHDKATRWTSQPNSLHDEEQISRSAMCMYDSATWRMYHRIMNDRKGRAAIAERLGMDTSDSENASSKPIGREEPTTPPSAYDSQESYKSNGSQSRPRQQSCAWSECSQDDEDIFLLEL